MLLTFVRVSNRFGVLPPISPPDRPRGAFRLNLPRGGSASMLPADFSAHERLAMRRKFAVLALLLTVGAQLSGCDKCGGWEEIRSPIPVKTCAGDAAR
jgi:hypothetical protein